MIEFDRENLGNIAKGGSCLLIVCVLLFGSIFLAQWGYASYKVYLMELEGKAKLAEAEYEKKIIVEEARAKKDAAKMLAEAEIEQARGVAEANAIIGKSLENNESYLRYLWIKGLQDGTSEVIYVPTEANLPILEANRSFKSGVTNGGK